VTVDWNAIDDDEFRTQVRAFVEANYPEELRFLSRRPRWHEIRPWCMALVEKGWAAPHWPVKYGGMGLSTAKLHIYMEELDRHGVSRQFLGEHGTTQLGPIIMRYGTDEQRMKWLPPMVRYETIWCQGYSEPNAGSDLAGVATEAVRDGDDFVINGRKIWTSAAMDATHMYLLTRTNKSVKKQLGISFFLLDLKQPGIEIRGIRNIAGSTEFCEVTLENARTPAANLIGGLDNGWTVAKGLLGFERLNSGSPRRSAFAFNRLHALGNERDLFADPLFAEKYVQFHLDMADLKAMYSYFAGCMGRGETLGADLSVLKILSSETNQRITEYAVKVAGDLGLAAGDGVDQEEIDTVGPYLVARNVTIGAGTTEIQRNIVASQVLNLPKD
jgi:alkylation response protein AidB-like acyl-CoA dehydrogenase